MLRACEGRYVSEELGAMYVVALEDGILSLQRGRLEPVALELTGPGEFAVDGLSLVFASPDAEHRPGLTVHAGRVKDIHFERIPD
jgi:hypothetical protein